MNTYFRVVLAILTLITFLALVAGFVWGIVVKIPIMVLVCFMIALGTSVFVYKDFLYFFGKNNDKE